MTLALRSGVLASLRSRACRRSRWLTCGGLSGVLLDEVLPRGQCRDPVTDYALDHLDATGINAIDVSTATARMAVGDERQPDRHSGSPSSTSWEAGTNSSGGCGQSSGSAVGVIWRGRCPVTRVHPGFPGLRVRETHRLYSIRDGRADVWNRHRGRSSALGGPGRSRLLHSRLRWL